MRKRNYFLIILLTLFILFGVFIIARPHYDCELTSGPHYCQLNSNNPRVLERIASSFPEDIQVKIGGSVLNLRQDLISTEENKKAMDLASGIYSEMSKKDGWSKLPSSLGISYEKILKMNFEQSQYFLYIPQNNPERVIVFLHGFGGNFNSYLYLLSEVAESTNSIIINPSYKQGVWDAESNAFIDEVIGEVFAKLGLKDLPLNLIGFSNGGLIIPDYMLNSNYGYRNIIGLSTYLDSNKYNQADFIMKIKQSNFIYIYGTQDERLALEDSFKSLNYLRENNIDVNSVGVEGTHLIFFENREEILNTIKSNILN